MSYQHFTGGKLYLQRDGEPLLLGDANVNMQEPERTLSLSPRLLMSGSITIPMTIEGMPPVMLDAWTPSRMVIRITHDDGAPTPSEAAETLSLRFVEDKGQQPPSGATPVTIECPRADGTIERGDFFMLPCDSIHVAYDPEIDDPDEATPNATT